MNTSHERLYDSLAERLDSVNFVLQNFTLNIAGGGNLFAIPFGNDYNATILDSILTAWNNGDFSNLPAIEILSSDILGNANGAFSQQTNKIYLADNFLNNAQPHTIEGVILEEIGHWIDAQINTVDPVWDEGEVFAKMLIPPSPPYEGGSLHSPPYQGGLGGIIPEDDSATIVIDGQEVAIEMSSPGDFGINTNHSAYTSSNNDFILKNPSFVYDGQPQGWNRMQCASYAYGRAIELGYFGNLQGLGSLIRNGAPDHAKDWDDNVGSGNWNWQPRRHSIVVWDDGPYGHVAFVEAVNYNSDGSVASFVITEHNRNLDEKFGSRTIYSSQSSFKAKFIYLSGEQPPSSNPAPIPDNNTLTNYPVFDAGYYLSVHSDVAAAYGSNNYEGAKSHWLNFGIKEGRKSSPFFDGNYYLSKNPDVAAAYGSTNYEGAISHWLTYGINEGRRASTDFDPIYYMAAHPDVEAAYGVKNFRGAMDHYLIYGRPGGWYGSELVTDPYVFDWNDYLSRNPDLAVNPNNAAVEATRYWYFNGINEGRRGSFEFDSRYYLARWEDVRAAFGANNYRGAMDHYLIYGKNDGRIGANDEPRYLSINDVTVTEGDGGSQNATFTVTLNHVHGYPITVNYGTANDSAIAGSDYNPVSGTLTFNPGESSKTISVAVLGDVYNEDNERFFLNLSSPSNATLSDGQGIGNIYNNDPAPNLTINDLTVTEGNSGSQNMTFTVSLSQKSNKTITVNYGTANDSAIAGSDYNPVSGTLTFAPHETGKTITVAILGDIAVEGNERFFVNLGGAVNANITDSQGIGTINNDDFTPNITINDVTVTEGDSGSQNMTFTVSLSSATNTNVTVNYSTANDSAIASSDYNAVNGTLTFTPGQTSQTITVPILGDTLDEDNERFFVNLSGAVNGNITDSQGIGTINDNEGTPTITINDVTVTEGNSGSQAMNFTVTLSNPSSKAVSVAYNTDYIYNGRKYTLTNGAKTWEQAQFEALQQGGNLVTINNAAEEQWLQSTFGNNQYFLIGLTDKNSEGNFTWISGEPVTYTNWHPNEPNDTEAREDCTAMNAPGWNDIPLTSPFYGIIETVQWYEYNGKRYTLTSNAKTWEDAQLEAQKYGGNLVTINNAAEEQWIKSTFGTSHGFWIGLTDKETEGTFKWINGEPVTYTNWHPNEPNNANGIEDYVNINFEPSRQWNDNNNTSVRLGIIEVDSPLPLTNQATGGIDYTITNGTLTFNAGETTKTITVPILGDTLDEVTERLKLTLSNPVNATISGTKQGVGTIIDNDTSPVKLIAVDDLANKSLKFDGINDYVEIPNDSAINFTKDQNFTVEAWIKIDPNQADLGTNDNDIIEKWGQQGALEGYPFVIRYERNTGKISVKRYDLVNNPQIHSTINVNDGNFHHVAFVKDGNTLKLYIDGKLDGQTTDTTTGITENNLPLSLGRRGNNMNYFTGEIDEVRIWNVARNQTEIQTNLNNSLTGKESGLVAYYNFNEGSGNAITDISNNNNHGVISGANWTESYQYPTISSIPKTPVDKGLKLEGVNDYVKISNFNNFPSNEITLEGWFKAENNNNIPLFSYAVTGEGNELLIYVDNNNTIEALWKGVKYDTNIPIPDNEWHHWAFSFSNSNDSFKIYLDGVEVSSNNMTIGESLTNGGTLILGQEQDALGGGFDPNQTLQGNLDEIRVWNVVRTPEQIKTNFTQSLTGKESGLVAYYNFNQGEGFSATDLTNNNNHGIINGASWSENYQYTPNKGLKFDGIDDYVSIANDSAFNFTKDQNFTVETWFKIAPNQSDVGDSILEKWGTHQPGEGYPFVIRYDEASQTIVGARYDGVNNPGVRIDGRRFNDGEFHHVAFVKDGSILKLYIDGKLEGENTDTTTGKTENTSLLSIGNRGGAGKCCHFGGNIDEVRIWNVARTQQQIETNLYNNLTGKETNLVGYWNFNEAKGSIVTDLTGNNNHGIISGATWSSSYQNSPINLENPPDKGLKFDGVDDYIQIPHNDSLSLSTFTIETWVKQTGLQNDWLPIITKESNGGGERNYGLYIHPTNHTIHYSFRDQSNTKWYSYDSEKTINLNEWNHLAMTYDGSNLNLYINGELDSSQVATGTPFISNHPIKIGKEMDVYGKFEGEIDEVRIWNVARTQEQIQTNLYNNLTGKETGLVGYWNFNEGKGIVATDLSNNINHGIISGATWVETNKETGIITDENTSLNINVLANDINPDNGTITIQNVTTTNTKGLVTINADKTIKYNPNGKFNYLNEGEIAIDTFTYTITNTQGAIDTATVTVTIKGIDGNENSNLPIMGETGKITGLTHQKQTITLNNSYTNPVVFVQPPSFKGSDPAIARIRGITDNSFTVSIQEPDYKDGSHIGENLSYFVFEAGIYQLADGTILEIGKFNTNKIAGQNWETIEFDYNFAEKPVVFSQVLDDNGPSFVKTRQQNLTPDSVQIALEEEEANKTSGHNTEPVGYMAISSGNGTWNGLNYEVGFTGNKITDKWSEIDFTSNFTQTPSLMANMTSYNGSDPASLRYTTLTNDGVTIKVEEEQSLDSEIGHVPENVGYLALEGEGNLSANPLITIGETGKITGLTHTQRTISLNNSYTNPVVFVQPPSFKGSDPAIARIRGITDNSFTVSIQEPDYKDGSHTGENLSYFVFEAGIYQLADGTVLEIGKFNTNKIAGQNWETIEFDYNFAEKPVVFSQVLDDNGASFVKTRQQNLTPDSVQIALEEEEANKTSGHNTEPVGYMAISSGNGTWNGLNYEVGFTGNKITDKWLEIDFTSNFTQTPSLMANMTSYNGSDPSSLRYDTLTNSGVTIKVEEEQSLDSEIGHVPENVGYLALEGAGNLTGFDIIDQIFAPSNDLI